MLRTSFAAYSTQFSMEHLPFYVSLLFFFTVLLTLWFLYKATNHSKTAILIAFGWLSLQGVLGYAGFYRNTDAFPPRLIFLLGPPLILIMVLFLLPKGRKIINRMIPAWLTWLHVVRIPIEFVLYWLYIHGQIPELMTFEGRNFDIVSGISAPFIAYLWFHKNYTKKTFLVLWNLGALLLLFSIVINAIFAAPFPFQLQAFEQPNVGVLYFPFIWLPAFIVPVVLFAHLVTLRILLKGESLNSSYMLRSENGDT